MVLVLSVLILCFASCELGEIPSDTGNTEENNQTGNTNDDNNETDIREEKYRNALALLDEGKYKEAYEAFKELGDYQDAKKQLSYFRYVPTHLEMKEEYGDETMTGMYKWVYNENGLPGKIDMSAVYGDESFSENMTLAYDDKGNLIQTIQSGYDGDTYIINYTYDVKGNLIKEVETAPDGDKYIYDYAYDRKGKLIKKTHTTYYDAEETLQHSSEYIYDEIGTLIREVKTYAGGNKYITDYTYDTKGNLIKGVYTDSDGDKDICDYTYDVNGNLIKVVYTDSDGDKDIYDFAYQFTYIPFELSEEVEQYLDIESILG